MFRRLLAPCVALAALVTCAPIAAAGDVPFPFDKVDRGAFAVGMVDLSRTTAKSLGEAAKAIMGDAAAELTAEGLAAADAAIKPLTDAGAERLYVVVSVSEAGAARGPILQIVVRHKAGADRRALVEALAALDPDGANTAPIGERWLRVEPGLQRTQPGVDEATTAALNAELEAIDEAAGGYALVMTPAFAKVLGDEVAQMERRAAQAPPDAPDPEAAMAELMRSILSMKSGRVGLTLGERPAFNARYRMPDADAAAKTIAAFDKAVERMKKQIADGGAGVSEVAWVGMMLGMLRPTADGADVVMNVDADQLRTFGQTVLLPALQRAREAAKDAVVLSNIRQINTVVLSYAADNQGQYPDSLDQLTDYLGGKEEADRILTHPTTGEKPGFQYVRPAKTISGVQNPSQTPVIYELRNGQRHGQGAVGYADGSVRRPPPPTVN